MPTRFRRRSPFAFFAIPFSLTLVAGYFGWQSTQGTFSSEARDALQAERQAREAELARLTVQRQSLDDKVRRLRSDALDADLLDERARANLNMARPNEIVIVHGDAPAPILAAHGR